MKTVAVAALRRFEYQDQTYQRGDLVPMLPIDASVHARRGDVSLTSLYRTQVLQAEDPKPLIRRRRRSRKITDEEDQAYRRSDLVAEVDE